MRFCGCTPLIAGNFPFSASVFKKQKFYIYIFSHHESKCKYPQPVIFLLRKLKNENINELLKPGQHKFYVRN